VADGGDTLHAPHLGLPEFNFNLALQHDALTAYGHLKSKAGVKHRKLSKVEELGGTQQEPQHASLV
jgi:hypothetical protein